MDAMIPITNAADYLSDMPDARPGRLPNLGHVPFEEDPGGSIAPVELILSGVSPRSVTAVGPWQHALVRLPRHIAVGAQ